MSISAIVIARNEEDNIKDCLVSLKFTDELILIDNNSSDRTVEVARKEGAKVYHVPGLDFSYLRNLGKEKAKSEWLLYVDADERITSELSKEIKKTLIENRAYSAYILLRKNYYLGKAWPKIEKMLRLVKKEALIGWQGMLHESAIVSGKVGYLNSFLLHYAHDNLSSMIAKTNEWSGIEAQLRYRNGHPPMSWWRFGRVMASSFWRSYVIEEGWKIGTTGLIESTYQLFSSFITYAKLWEKQNKLKMKNNNEQNN